MTRPSSMFHLLTRILMSRQQKGKGCPIPEQRFQEINWDAFTAMIERHNLSSLTYAILKQNFSHLVPEPYLARMKGTHLVNAGRTLYFTATLHTIIEMLEKNGIECVPLKGPAFAEQLYGDISYRTFSDLDILVPGEKAYQACKILIQNRFRPELTLNEKQFSRFMLSEDHFILTSPCGRISIELHWELSARYLNRPFTYRDLAPGLRQSQLHGRPIRMFSHEDLLVYICLHGSKHLYISLEMIYLAACAITPDLDWDQVLLKALNLGCKKKLLLGLHLCVEHFDINLPEKIQMQIEHTPGVKRLGDYVKKLLLRPLEEIDWEMSRSKFTRYQIRALDTFPDQVRYLFFVATFPTNNDWAWTSRLHEIPLLYYAARPLRLLKNVVIRNRRTP